VADGAVAGGIEGLSANGAGALPVPAAAERASRAITWERTGRAVHVQDAADLLAWVDSRRVPSPTDARKLRVLYATVIEAMANTREHAGPGATWRLHASVARRDGKRIVAVAFLDDGRGLVSTWRDNRAVLGTDEQVLSRFLGQLGRGSATDGFRGRGLATLRDALDEGLVEDVRLVANCAAISFASGRVLSLSSDSALAGTLLAWRMTLESGR
jgi:hypothetical protein